MKTVNGWTIGGCAALVLSTGCAEVPDVTSSESTELTQGPPSVIELRGRTFLRRADWAQDEFDRILYEGRSDQVATTPEVLAAQMRAHTVVNGEYYIEMEPNVEMARHILNDPIPAPKPYQLPREERTIISGDNRSLLGNSSTQFPGIAMGFNNSKGSGVKLAAHAMYTAAHVVFDTLFTNGWYCDNGSTSSSCSVWPKWRFGVSGTSGFTSWTTNGCYAETSTTAFVNLTTSDTPQAVTRWDYAAIDTTACTDGNTGWFGSTIASDTDLLNMTGRQLGYAERATCPTGSNGTDGVNMNINTTDCPGTGAWPGSTWQLTGAPQIAPYTAAHLWVSAAATDVAPGPSPYGANIVQSSNDITLGDSGGPLYTDDGGYWVVGVSSDTGTSQNYYNRLNSEVWNFLAAYAPF